MSNPHSALEATTSLLCDVGVHLCYSLIRTTGLWDVIINVHFCKSYLSEPGGLTFRYTFLKLTGWVFLITHASDCGSAISPHSGAYSTNGVFS